MVTTASGSSPKGTVIVAVNFNEQTKYLVDTAVVMCQRSGWGLRLLHVLAPQVPVAWYGDITLNLKLSDLAEAETEINRNEALFQLEEVAKRVPSNINLDLSVMTDDVNEGILAEARGDNSKLLICGSIGGSYRFVPKSMSVVLSLMANTPIPVLVLNETAPHPFSQQQLKLLVLDDLSVETANLFKGNFKFLSQFKDIDLLHLHVSGLNKASLAAALTAVNAAGRNGVNIEAEVDDLFASMQDRSLSRLHERSSFLLESCQGRALVYEAKVEYGNIHEAISKQIEAFKPDVLCFGKHHSIRHRPFNIGQVPYSSMLAYKLPILVIGGDGC